MFQFSSRAALAVALCAGSTMAAAQIVEPVALAPTSAPTESLPPTVTMVPSDLKLPALTVVELKVLDDVSSKTAITGQPVKLALASPLYLASDFGLPAGTPVEGVVIHSARPGMGGKAGELLIGAKRIALSPSVEVPLRSFKLTPARGKNNEVLAMGVTAAIGVAGLLISGGSATAPAGASAAAKTAADVSIPMTLLTKLPARSSPPAVASPQLPTALPTTNTSITTTTNQGSPK